MSLKNQWKFKDLFYSFLELEKDEDLIDFEIRGIKLWQYLRYRIFLLITQKSGLYNLAHTKNIKFKYILKCIPSLLFYSLFSNPLLGNYKRKYLFFNTGRKTEVDGNLVDIYTQYFIEKEKINNYELIEEIYELRHQGIFLKNRKHQDAIKIISFFSTFLSKFNLSQEELNKIKVIEDKIKSIFDIEIELEKLFRNGYITFRSDYVLFSRMLKKRVPEKIFIVCSYANKMPLIAAAKNQNIETVELQHGTISSYHIGYVYPDNKKPAYFPDKFYAFGRYWVETSSLPIDKENIVIKGFPYFSFMKNKYSSVARKKNQILIISQGTIGAYMVDVLYDSIDQLSKYNIKYKLHPGEFSRWEEEYPKLYNLRNRNNIEIIDNNNVNLYQYIAESEYVIGVYSTAIYEALGFGCKVILLNLPGIEYMETIIEKGFVSVVSDFKDLESAICNLNDKENDIEIFA